MNTILGRLAHHTTLVLIALLIGHLTLAGCDVLGPASDPATLAPGDYGVPGHSVLVGFEDNGEGAGAPADRHTYIYYYTSTWANQCVRFADWIENGRGGWIPRGVGGRKRPGAIAAPRLIDHRGPFPTQGAGPRVCEAKCPE
jgi:hypothetical protein